MQYSLSREYWFLRSLSKYTDKYVTWQTAGWPLQMNNKVNLNWVTTNLACFSQKKKICLQRKENKIQMLSVNNS